MRIRHIAAITTLTALALTACQPTEDTGSSGPKPTKASKPDPKKLDDSGKQACDDFAEGYKAAQTTSARVDLTDKVSKSAPKSGTDRIADTAVVLARAADGSDGSWQIAADTFATACLDAGWKA